MQKFPLWFVWVVGVVLILSACQANEGHVEDLPQPRISPTVVLVEQDAPLEEPIKINADSVQPTPYLSEDETADTDELACEAPFCLLPWPGWLERPIGEGYIRTIDRSYPYASTGDGNYDLHHGVEFLNKYGSPVLAALEGEVVFAGSDDMDRLGPFWAFYGNVVILQHAGLLPEGVDVFTLYAHLSEVDVFVGQKVTTGEVLGKIGATGAADGPHLHFETRVFSNDYAHTVNPVLWFAPLDDPDHQKTATLAGIILDQWGNPITKFPLTLEKLNQAGAVEAYYYPKTYHPGPVNAHPLLGENFTLPDIPAGNYRLAFIYGRMYEFFFTLEPGMLGFLQIQLD